MIEYHDTGRYWQESSIIDEIIDGAVYDCFEIEFINNGVKWFVENWWLGHNPEAIWEFVNESVFHNCDKWETTYTQQDALTYIDGRVIRPAELLSCGMVFYYKVDDA